LIDAQAEKSPFMAFLLPQSEKCDFFSLLANNRYMHNIWNVLLGI